MGNGRFTGRALRRRAVGALALIALAGFGAAEAHAAKGDLRFVQCVDDVGPGGDDCARSAPGLGTPLGLAISPDGRSVYVAAYVDGAVAHLRRNKRTGKLRSAGCVESPPLAACAAEAQGLGGVTAVAVHPNGRHVYAVSGGDGALMHLKRNKRTGKLTYARCIADTVEGVACPARVPGLSGANDLAISRDGRSLYVAAVGSHAITHFRLNKRTGAPRFAACIEDDDAPTDQCSARRQGLWEARAVEVSRNGKFVYVVSGGNHDPVIPLRDAAVAYFKRNKKSGALKGRGCIADNDHLGDDDCGGRRADGIYDAWSLGLSPDGRFLYAGTFSTGAFGVFAVRNGVPSFRYCVEAPLRPPPCAVTAQAIGRSVAFAFDSRGRSMYVATARGIQPFIRQPRSGILAERPCIDDDDAAPYDASCQRRANGLLGATALAVSPDDRFLYAASSNEDAVSVFRRKR